MARLLYRLLGVTVWRVARWYLFRRFTFRRLLFTVVAGLAGAVAARRGSRRHAE
jgi:hypothetical protein